MKIQSMVVLTKTEIRLITPSLQHVTAKHIEILVILPKQQEDHLNYWAVKKKKRALNIILEVMTDSR